MRRTVALALVTTLLLLSCSADDSDDANITDLDDAVPIAALQPFDDCAALLDHVRQVALDRVGPYGLEGTQIGFTEVGRTIDADVGLEEGAPVPAAGDSGAEPRVEGRDYSGTNLQEVGVDEADMIKTDGERVVTVQQGTLYLLDTTTAAPTIIDSLELPGVYDAELFLHGERVLVIAATDGSELAGTDDLRDDLVGTSGTGATLLAEVDLSGEQQVELVSSQVVTGSYVSARAVDGTARVVLGAPGGDLGWVQPTGPRAEEAAEEANRRVIETSSADDWLPAVGMVDRSGTELTPGVECGDVSRPAAFSGFGTTTILTVDLDEPLGDLDPVTVLADARTVYAGPEALYVATSRWGDIDLVDAGPTESGPTTEVHRFDISEEGPAVYTGSGRVRGELLDQFSLSEHEGVLRVATTDTDPVTGETESFVTTFENAGGELRRLGQVGDMGHGEEIFAVRFVGDVAYVVTFEQTDPFYTLDLGDPTDPRVVGELKILGYSAYLHPVGDDRILGVGQDATEDGRTLGTQVSLFDVSDAASPRRVAQYAVDDSSSSVEVDHRAFLWWDPTDLAVLPVQSYGSGFSGALGLTVTEDGITESGHITHPSTDGGSRCPAGAICEQLPCPPEADCVVPPAFAAPILRSLVVDDQIWTLSATGVQVNDLQTLADEGHVALAG